MKKSRILVCGGRDFCGYAKFQNVMASCLPFFGKDFVIIQGGATGADRMAFSWARNNGYPEIEIGANWGYYGTIAGTIRNGWMIKYGTPDLVIAFPGGTGTANMIKQAEAAGIDVLKVD